MPEGFVPRRIGTLGEIQPETRQTRLYPTMEQYVKVAFPWTWFRHWVGISRNYRTLDHQYYALDLYWQTPNTLYTDIWAWYIVLDQCEPSEYWRGLFVNQRAIPFWCYSQKHCI